jgi:hypothetical protein
MSKIDMQNGKINFDGEWLSSEDLTNKIQEKMQTGDMKFSKLAAVLEELNVALENSHKIETKILLLKEDYEKLKALGGDDEPACVKKAVMAYIESANKKEHATAPAGTSEDKKKKEIRHQDHFLG